MLRIVCVQFILGKLSGRPRIDSQKQSTSSASIALARTFFISVHSVCMGPLSVVFFGGGLFGSDNGSLK